MSFRNDDKQFGSESFSGSKFRGFTTRYKTLCRISTGLEDTDGTQFPTSKQIFLGLFSDDIVDTEIETHININDISQALVEFPAANIAASVTGSALTANQIISTIRDYQDGGGNVVLSEFISSSAWLITSTTRTYTIPTSTDLQGVSGLDLIEKLAQADNHVFYVDGSGNAVFTIRDFSATSDYTFNGPGQTDVNIISLDSFSEGINRVFTKVSLIISDPSFVSTQQTFTVGDGSSSDLYGQREISFENNFVTSDTAGSICSDLLVEFQTKRKELALTTKYITQLQLNRRVTVTYTGEPAGDGSLWDHFLWDINLWGGFQGGLEIDEDFGVTQIDINMDRFKTKFYLRQV